MWCSAALTDGSTGSALFNRSCPATPFVILLVDEITPGELLVGSRRGERPDGFLTTSMDRASTEGLSLGSWPGDEEYREDGATEIWRDGVLGDCLNVAWVGDSLTLT